MKKWILFFSLFALLILVSFGTYLYIFRAEFTSTLLSRTLQVPVSIEKIDIGKDGLTINNFVIANPSNCTMKNAFSEEVLASR